MSLYFVKRLLNFECFYIELQWNPWNSDNRYSYIYDDIRWWLYSCLYNKIKPIKCPFVESGIFSHRYGYDIYDMCWGMYVPKPSFVKIGNMIYKCSVYMCGIKEKYKCQCNDYGIKWKHFPRFWPFVRGIYRHRWIPLTKASDAERWCFLWSAPE